MKDYRPKAKNLTRHINKSGVSFDRFSHIRTVLAKRGRNGKPSYTPDWGSAKRVDIKALVEKVLAA